MAPLASVFVRQILVRNGNWPTFRGSGIPPGIGWFLCYRSVLMGADFFVRDNWTGGFHSLPTLAAHGHQDALHCLAGSLEGLSLLPVLEVTWRVGTDSENVLFQSISQMCLGLVRHFDLV